MGKSPVRTCVGCRSTRDQAELVRVARDKDGNLRLGRTLPGRGAWLCQSSLIECTERAAKTGGFSRAFRSAISPAMIVDLKQLVDRDRLR